MSDIEQAKAGLIQLTIKNVPYETRLKMNIMAAKRDQSLGRWLTEVVDHAEAYQRGDMVLPRLFEGRDDRPHGPHMPDEPRNEPISVSDMAAIVAIAEKAANGGIPRNTRSHFFALINDRLRAARGLPPVRRTAPLLTIKDAQDDG